MHPLCFISITTHFSAFSFKSAHEPPFHWMPLARLEKNRSRTPLLPEPTAMDMLYEQLKVKARFRSLAREGHTLSSSSAEQNTFSDECRVIERIDFRWLIIEPCFSSPMLLEQPWKCSGINAGSRRQRNKFKRSSLNVCCSSVNIRTRAVLRIFILWEYIRMNNVLPLKGESIVVQSIVYCVTAEFAICVCVCLCVDTHTSS